jgi:hypothetical protein
LQNQTPETNIGTRKCVGQNIDWSPCLRLWFVQRYFSISVSAGRAAVRIPTRHRSAILDRASFSLHLNEYTTANASEELLTSTLDAFLCVSNII